jgi:hypothetical protein
VSGIYCCVLLLRWSGKPVPDPRGLALLRG